jgi:hypothetical protein
MYTQPTGRDNLKGIHERYIILLYTIILVKEGTLLI